MRLFFSKYKFFFGKIIHPSIKNIIDSEIHYRSMFDNNHVNMMLINPKTHDIIDVNPAACSFYGYDKTTMLTMKISDINMFSKDEITIALNRSKTGIQNRFHFRHKLASGKIKDVDVASGTITIKGEELLYSIIYDISESKLTEEKLIKSEALYRKLFENMLNGFAYCKLIVNDDGSFDYVYLIVNESFVSLTGLKDVEGKLGSEVIPGIQITDNLLLETFANVATTGIPKNFEIYVEGLKMWFSISVYSLQKEYFVVVFDVITERKVNELQLKDKTEEIEAQNEEYKQINDELYYAKVHAEESDRLKTAFLQNMSHEIRTPMNAIMGFSDLLPMQFNNKAKLEHYSSIIRQRSLDLLDLINELLDFAKIESGQLPIHLEEFHLFALFSELEVFFKENQKRLGNQHIKFVVDKKSFPHDLVMITDLGKLKQIFINLIGNAFKFTTDGEIRVGSRLRDNSVIEFFVSDTGIGIPLEKQQQIFDRFVQLDYGENKLYGGTGLGLSIVKGLIVLMQGDIRLESTVDSGTIFYFTVTYKIADSALPIASSLKSHIHYYFPQKMVLIVEDDKFNAEFLKEILVGTGLVIHHTILGQEAIEWACSNAYDLVLLDVDLPDITGYEVSRKIKLQKPDLKIIIQTAYSGEDDRKTALSEGCTDYISKPLNKDILLSMLNKHLQ